MREGNTHVPRSNDRHDHRCPRPGGGDGWPDSNRSSSYGGGARIPAQVEPSAPGALGNTSLSDAGEASTRLSGGTWSQDFIALLGLLERRRKDLKLSQKELAARLGISVRHLRRIEAGELSVHSISASLLFGWAASVGLRIFDPQSYLETERKEQ